MAENSENLPHYLVLRCAFIAGKVIDRNVISSKPSFAKAMDPDEQIEGIAASMPGDWWDLPREVPVPGSDLEDLRERLLQQSYFFHVKIYIHLPFLVKSATTFPHSISKVQFMGAFRQFLRRFQMLRTKIQGVDLFDCKKSDFLGFLAPAVLLIGLDNSSDKPKLQGLKEELRLILSIERIFIKDADEKESKLASQCHKTIGILLGNIDGNSGSLDPLNEPQKIRIPYFSTAVRRSAKQLSPHPFPANFHFENQGNTLISSRSQELLLPSRQVLKAFQLIHI